jgi:hypothetical protein
MQCDNNKIMAHLLSNQIIKLLAKETQNEQIYFANIPSFSETKCH